MYSLYRAWLSLGPVPISAPLPPPLPPPPPPPPSSSSTATLSGPGPVQGPPDVHLQVGPGLTHFSAHRNVLSNHSGFFKAALINYQGPTPISVPNVNIDEFSSLLTFMYTGYLDLNISNIYNILLATHILHMPRALEICRNFLLQQTQTTIEQQTQLRHTANTIIKPIPSRKMFLPTQQMIFTPMYSNLKKSDLTPFKQVGQEKPDNDDNNYHCQASTSKIVDDNNLLNDNIIASEKKKKKKNDLPNIQNNNNNNNNNNNTNNNSNNDKVIIDIACCDGPVRFHRVINKNYGHQNGGQIDNYHHQIKPINRDAILNKVMNENIKQSDENQQQQQQQSELFTCLYCNHTFKSQYCYQKHARRHLNPVSIDAKITPKETSKREVKLLDMNVQYYPCKTCGSKFPSYYFVHKHRKLCHAEEMADNNNKNNEMVPEGGENNSTNSSAIDVVATGDNN